MKTHYLNIINKLYLGIAICILLIGGAVAQNAENSGDIDTVILVTSSNYPDAIISSAVTERLGIPVLLTEKDQLSDPAKNGIEKFDPEEVIVIGGPAVISEEVESSVEQMTNTTRLWGNTQVGTSVEVSDYFWSSGSEKVTIVQYPQGENGHELLATVKNDIDGEGPVLISKEGTLSASVLSEVERLEAEEAEIYSTSAINVTEDLQNVGVTDVEIEEGEQEELEEKLKQRTDTENKSELVIVAAANFRHTISVPVSPNGASYIVSSESEIDGAVNAAANTNSNTSIKVVGKPDLADMIADRIENETDKTVERVSGEPEQTAATEMEKKKELFEKRQKKRLGKWKEEIENNPGLEKAANKTLQRARDQVDENSSERVQNILEKAEKAFKDGKHFQAKKLSTRAASIARTENYRELDQEEKRERAREEKEDMREASKELKENSQEMAQELKEAETVEERLEVIKEYREERRETVNKMKEKMKKNRKHMNKSDEKEWKNESEEDTESELKLKVEGNEIESEASYTANTGGYKMAKSVTRNGETINFEFEVTSPPSDSLNTQVITELEEEESIEVEKGSYSVKSTLSLDGDVIKSLSQEVNVTGKIESSGSESPPELPN